MVRLRNLDTDQRQEMREDSWSSTGMLGYTEWLKILLPGPHCLLLAFSSSITVLYSYPY